MLQTLRYACLVPFALLVLIVADAPFRTFRQKYDVNRLRERLILLTFELDLVALWALAVFVFHWEHRLSPRSVEETFAVIGLLVTFAGAGLTTWARIRLGPWFTGSLAVKTGHELVTDGPYGITRHPMYTGLLLMVLGAALVWNSLLTLLLAVLLAAPFFLQTVYEEALFEEHFGSAYHDYQRRVPRLVPFLRMGRPAE